MPIAIMTTPPEMVNFFTFHEDFFAICFPDKTQMIETAAVIIPMKIAAIKTFSPEKYNPAPIANASILVAIAGINKLRGEKNSPMGHDSPDSVCRQASAIILLPTNANKAAAI